MPPTANETTSTPRQHSLQCSSASIPDQIDIFRHDSERTSQHKASASHVKTSCEKMSCENRSSCSSEASPQAPMADPEKATAAQKNPYPSELNQENFKITWEGPEDPSNPKNWSGRRKWAAVFVVSSFTFVSPVSSSMVSPALEDMERDLNMSGLVSSMVMSIFVLAYAVGPLFFGPLSEVYGRVIIIQLSNLLYLVFNLACGFATTGPQMLVFRFLGGLGGSAPLAVGAAVLGDCFAPEQRGKAVSIYALAPLLGPAIGPIAGGFIAEGATWRWIFWSTTILDVAIQISGLLFLQETYAPVLLMRKAAKMRKETGRSEYFTEFDDPDRSLRAIMSVALTRPFVMLWSQPIIQAIAVYMAYLYGLFYLMIASFPSLWTGKYGESTSIGSLNFISMGVGFFLGTQISAPINDRVYRKLKLRHGGHGRPEFRVPPMFVGSILIPVGLFTYGWTAQAHTHWIVPNIWAAVFCAGSIVCFQAMTTYIVDSYARYAASGLAAAVVLRSIAGFAFPLFTKTMYERLGYGWGNSLLGFISIGIGLPAPILFWYYGEKLRSKSRFVT